LLPSTTPRRFAAVLVPVSVSVRDALEPRKEIAPESTSGPLPAASNAAPAVPITRPRFVESPVPV
jgi:hypothetical protein